ncbi:MAG: hypothetical protein BalsKO_02420 [Balneolaceae bacterium]
MIAPDISTLELQYILTHFEEHKDTLRTRDSGLDKISLDFVKSGTRIKSDNNGYVVISELNIDSDHPYFYPKPSNYVPGLMIIEFARQFGIYAATEIYNHSNGRRMFF